jgi:uncharacterized protein YggE
MKKLLIACLLICGGYISAQNTTTIQNIPFVETAASVDTLVVPDRIYLNIRLDENDSKGKVSVEELEKRMESALKNAGVDLQKQVSLGNFGSNFSKYFLRKKDVSKVKLYELVLYDAQSVTKVLLNLEKVKISNVRLTKLEYSQAEALGLILKSQAVTKAKMNADYLAKPLNQKVGPAISINDMNSFNRGFVPMNADADQIVVTGWSKSKSEMNVEFKKIELSASVRVRFKLY